MMTLFKKPHLLYLLTIIVIGGLLRFYGINWDQAHHLHPDERAIVMFATPIEFPKSFDEFLSPSSPLNPHFFAYGNFPLYLLKAVASFLANFDPLYISYEKINLVGRAISAIADIGTIFVVFILTKKLMNQTAGLIASFFYAISVFPIQAAHFYAVDTLLTFFILLTLYQLLRFYEKPSFPNAILVGVFFGLSLVTKISAIPLIIAILVAITVDFILIFIKQPHKPHIWFPHIPRFLKRLIFDGITIAVATIITFVILQPYAIIDFQEFWRQSMQQRQMTYDAFTFPYTLQYVGKIPYFHELKNVFLWGQGPLLATLSLLGIVYISFSSIRKHLGWWRSNDFDSSEVDRKWNQKLILLVFLFTYFFIVGKFAVGWMRYMLPLYPLFCLFAAIFAVNLINPKLKSFIKNKSILNTLYLILYTSVMLWTLSFMNIYTKPNTRVLASNWINQNLPNGKTLAIEHWDDGLPLFGGEKYNIISLPLYDPDTQEKWGGISQKLETTDYIIVASNRLYVPLQKLTNCNNLPSGRCYAQTADYYERLFNSELGFKKVAEFAIYPTIPLLNIPINDQGADESFTVYDHPKVMIFKREISY